jgi:hypothetical protein
MIALVIPSIRPESYEKFFRAWHELIEKHEAILVKVEDGKNPTVCGKSVKEVMGKYSDTIYNFNDGVRNLGFAYVKRFHPEIDMIITLDDDVEPSGDTILDHCTALQRFVSTSWLSTASEYTRGFPYGVRNESEVVLSHGVWEGVADWDAPTQLIRGNPPLTFYQGVIPKGVLYPMCSMNVAFKVKILPYLYQAPMGPKIGIDRFADIWGGIEAKKDIDRLGWAVVSGYATVSHTRASNVFVNLQKESVGLSMNESYGQGSYFKLFREKRKRWEEFCHVYS